MIVDSGGRWNSHRTAEEFLALAQKDIASLSVEEREMLQMIVEDMQAYGKSPALEMASQSLYRSPPVDMDRFLDDPYFCGKISKGLFPAIRGDLTEIFSGRYQECIISGSIGAGKSTLGIFAIIRMLYDVSQLRDPQEAYGIARGDKICFPMIAVNESLAVELVSNLQARLEEIPYFQQEFKPLKQSEASGILFPNGIWVPPGASTERRTIGLNAFGSVLDEGNFFQKKTATEGFQVKGESRNHAEEIYKAIKRRMESRFMAKGRLPGMIVILSSKRNIYSFTEKRIKESINDPNVFVRERAVYEVTPKERFSGKTFKVAIGNEVHASRIVEPHEADPLAMKVIEVPEEFRESFESDIEMSIRDISGYATVAITPFIERREKIEEAIDHDRSHPFTEHVWSHDFAAKFQWEKLCGKAKDGAWEPKHYPSAPRFVALDLSKSGDATGFVVGCLGPYVSVSRLGKDTEMAPLFHIDFMLRIEAASNGEVVQSEIRNLVYDLSAHGFFIKQISADQFQSVGFLQTMRQKGYHTVNISVDRTTGPYDLIRNAFYENRISIYRYAPLIKELRELQKNWKTGKIDHPDPSEVPGASKDVADALAQVVVQLQASVGTMDVTQPTTSAENMIGDDENWVLENAIAVPESVEDANQESWRKEGQKRLDQAQVSRYDHNWRQNFQSPFETG